MDMAKDPTHVGAGWAAFLFLPAVALAVASHGFLRAGLAARRREQRRERQRQRNESRSAWATRDTSNALRRRPARNASPHPRGIPRAPAEVEEDSDAPAQVGPPSSPQRRPTRDVSIALRRRPARNASPHPARNHAARTELLGFLRGLDAKFRLYQDDPEDGAESKDWLRAHHAKTKNFSRCDVGPEQSSNASHCLPGEPLGASPASSSPRCRHIVAGFFASSERISTSGISDEEAGADVEPRLRANDTNACTEDDTEDVSIGQTRICPSFVRSPVGFGFSQRYNAALDSAKQRDEPGKGEGTPPDSPSRFAAPAGPVYTPTPHSRRYPTMPHAALGARAQLFASEDRSGHRSSGSV